MHSSTREFPMTAEGINKVYAEFGLPGDWSPPRTPSPPILEIESGAPPTAGDLASDEDSDDSAPMILSARIVQREEKRQARREEKKNKILDKVTFESTGLSQGEVMPPSEIPLCPWALIKAYPEMYIGKKNGPRAAPFFENEAILKDREWDFFYIYNPTSPLKERQRPILLVPTRQFDRLLAEINGVLGIQLTIPEGKNVEKFQVVFKANGPLPRFLGRSVSCDSYSALQVPEMLPVDTDMSKMSRVAAMQFGELLTRMQQDYTSKGNRHSRSNKSEKARRRRIEKRRRWSAQMRSIQYFLGLRPGDSEAQEAVVGAANAETAEETNGATTSGVDESGLDLARPLPYKPKRHPIFVAIDIEVYEMNHNCVTEVGVAVLDTKDVEGVAPGAGEAPGLGGYDWFKKIKGHHFRVKEHMWAINRQYVLSCPGYFQFGQSVIIEEENVAQQMQTLLSVPDTSSTATEKPLRPVILVFHDSSQDLVHLNQLNVDVNDSRSLPQIVDIVDTADLETYVSRGKQTRKLETVLQLLQIPSCYLHNAGNDAVYTMQALVGLAVNKRLDGLARKNEMKEDGLPIPYGEFKGNRCDDEGWSTDAEADMKRKMLTAASLPMVPDLDLDLDKLDFDQEKRTGEGVYNDYITWNC